LMPGGLTSALRVAVRLAVTWVVASWGAGLRGMASREVVVEMQVGLMAVGRMMGSRTGGTRGVAAWIRAGLRVACRVGVRRAGKAREAVV
jgi:hypothetical protein